MLEAHILTVANIALVSLIMFRLFGRWKKFPAFSVYLGYSLISGTIQYILLVVFGVESPIYHKAFHYPNLLVPILQFLVLIDLYRRLFCDTKSSRMPSRGFIILSTACLVLLSWEIGNMQASWFVRYHALALAIQIVAWLHVYRTLIKKDDLVLGKNWRGIMVGTGLMVSCQSINFAQFLYGKEPFAYFSFFVQFIYFLAVAVYVHGLWNDDPLTRLGLEQQLQLGRLRTNLKTLLRQLLELR